MSLERSNPTTNTIDEKDTSTNFIRPGNNDKDDGENKIQTTSTPVKSVNRKAQSILNHSTTVDTSANIQPEDKNDRQQAITVGRFFSICLTGTLEKGSFDNANDVYVKYSIVAGPDWILSSGLDVGITQIARYKLNEEGKRIFIWNQPITLSYRSYNFFGWPQIVVSVYRFDIFGSEQILGYGCAHLPVSSQDSSNIELTIKVYSPQSSSYLRQILSWITGRKPELVDSKLFARGDCRSLLQTVTVGELELTFNQISKDVMSNGYRS